MLDVLLIAGTLTLSGFAWVLLFGAPYLPTLKPQITAALDIAQLKPGQHLLELGSGDGRVMLAAAKQGIRVTGYELNPFLVLFTKFRLRKYPSAHVKWGNFWKADLATADAIFVFLLPKYMNKLDTKIVRECKRPVTLISFAFPIADRKEQVKSLGLFVYRYNQP